jgi:RNA polymerase sigma-70 factor (ECF subfamily)
MDLDSHDTVLLLEKAAAGDHNSLQSLFVAHADRLGRMISLRIDPRILARVDVADVLQEVQIEAWQHLPEYMRNRNAPFYLWLRGVAVNKLLELHRRHLGTKMRDARREIPFDQRVFPEASSTALATHLTDSITSASVSVIRDEAISKVVAVVNDLNELDREVLALRHFEQLTPAETAMTLGISEKAAGMRYLRALQRLKDALQVLPGGLSELRSATR